MSPSLTWEAPLEPVWESGTAGCLDGACDVHLWRWHPAALTIPDHVLSAEERTRASALKPRERARYRGTRGAVRQILGTYLGCPVEDVVLRRTSSGRPFVASPATDLDFNLSHSGELAVLALCRGGRLGVDIEAPRTVRRPLAVAKKLFPAGWSTWLEIEDEAERQRRFLYLWTRFEACQKASGDGVFSVVRSGESHHVMPFFADDVHIGHLCLSLPERPSLRFFDLSTES